MSSKLESLEEAIAYAKTHRDDTNVYYSDDPYPHGHWHVIWAGDYSKHYDKLEGYHLKAKIRWHETVELI